MFNHLPRRKWLMGAVALLIVGSGTLFLWKYEGTSGGAALVMQAWQAAFQNSGGYGAEVILPPNSGSDLSGVSGQDSAPTDPGSAARNTTDLSWPTSILPTVATGASKSSPSGDAAAKSDLSVPDLGSSGQTEATIRVGLVPAASSSSTATTSAILAAPTLPQWCDFSASARTDASLIFNEVAWMGSTRSPNDEWFELKNVVARNLQIGNWQVQDQSGSIKIILAATTTIAQESFLLLARNGATVPGARIDMNYSGALANAGGWLKVFDAHCQVVDELNAASGWSAGNNITKQTLERDVAGTGWHTSVAVGGSPAAQNSVIASSPSSSGNSNSGTSTTSSTSIATTTTTTSNDNSATSSTICAMSSDSDLHPLIAAVQITGGAGATANDYIKIYDPATTRLDLSGWKLRKRTKSGSESSIKVFANGSSVAAAGYFTWANSSDGFAATMNANASSTQTLSDDSSIALLDASDTVVDAVAWGSGHITPFIEGQAYPTNPAENQVLKRKIVSGVMQDSDNNALDFSL